MKNIIHNIIHPTTRRTSNRLPMPEPVRKGFRRYSCAVLTGAMILGLTVPAYSLNQKQQLTAFLGNGEVPISNNLAENAIRPFTLGRKNWLFCDTPKGAEASAVVYSMVESAKANGVEPFAYLQRVLVELPYLGKSPSHEELEAFIPWAPDIQEDCKISNSDAYTNTYLE